MTSTICHAHRHVQYFSVWPKVLNCCIVDGYCTIDKSKTTSELPTIYVGVMNHRIDSTHLDYFRYCLKLNNREKGKCLQSIILLPLTTINGVTYCRSDGTTPRGHNDYVIKRQRDHATALMHQATSHILPRKYFTPT